jgi:hypothetical protein
MAAYAQIVGYLHAPWYHAGTVFPENTCSRPCMTIAKKVMERLSNRKWRELLGSTASDYRKRNKPVSPTKHVHFHQTSTVPRASPARVRSPRPLPGDGAEDGAEHRDLGTPIEGLPEEGRLHPHGIGSNQQKDILPLLAARESRL